MKNTNKTSGKTETESVGVTETQTEYKQVWSSYILQLHRIGLSLRGENLKDLIQCIDKLDTLVDVADKLQQEREIDKAIQERKADEQLNALELEQEQ